MVLTHLWYYIMGYVEVTITGLAIERFINLALREDVLIWDIVNYRGGLKAKVKAKDFSRLRAITKNTECKVKVIEKYGLPFIFIRLRERKLLTIGLLFSILVLIYLSTYIWFIDIEGNEQITNSEIESVIGDHGLKIGGKRTDINPTDIEKRLKAEFDQIVWAGIDFTGTRALVKVTEKEEEPEILEGATNIVAIKDAYIVDTMIFSGYPTVEVGDSVRSGDILVYGRVVPSTVREGEIKQENELLDYPRTQAKGFIRGRIHHHGYGQAALKEETTVKTGEKITDYGIAIDGNEWFLDLKDVPFVEYDKRKTIRKYELPIIDINVGMLTKTYIEIDKQSIERDEREAKQLAKKRAMRDATEQRKSDQHIVDYQYQYLDNPEDQIIAVRAILSVETDIGKEIEAQ